ncbi:DUF6221 family protein [Streptomyces cellulosae]|uniref:DUF6221 family protein n=1 Tax=Streptomyces cellulosae TaxID=1968 RepID=A0ABW6JPY5_STRCE
MDDLVQWLRAQLDEDERIARGTGQPGTSWQNVDMDGELRGDVNAGTVAYVPREETRAHIAAWDPARVLREIDAKRQALAHYARVCELKGRRRGVPPGRGRGRQADPDHGHGLRPPARLPGVVAPVADRRPEGSLLT